MCKCEEAVGCLVCALSWESVVCRVDSLLMCGPVVVTEVKTVKGEVGATVEAKCVLFSCGASCVDPDLVDTGCSHVCGGVVRSLASIDYDPP